jgi:hypothetical protein
MEIFKVEDVHDCQYLENYIQINSEIHDITLAQYYEPNGNGNSMSWRNQVLGQGSWNRCLILHIQLVQKEKIILI